MWPDLFKKWKPTPTPQYEASAKIDTPDLLLKRMHWTLLRPFASTLWGNEHSSLLGPGIEVAEIRPYQPGDDIRFIDWNITARTEQPMLREAHLERAIDVWFLLDLSASTRWGTAQCLKHDRALEFTAAAGQILNRNGNRLGAQLFAEQDFMVIPPSSGKLHLMHLLNQMHKYKGQRDAKPTDLREAMTRVERIIQRKALVIIVSDFLVVDGWQAPLNRLARRHEVIAVRLYDPREGELPDVGLITLEDPETGEQLLVNSSDRQLRERFQQATRRQTEEIRSKLLSCGVDQLFLSTNEDFLPTFASFLHARSMQRKQRANTLVH